MVPSGPTAQLCSARLGAVLRLCVFCGSNAGTAPGFADTADRLGRALAGRRIGLVYGGGDVGLMGVVADAVLDAGGEVTGVIPEFLEQAEVAHGGLTTLHVVGSMHERKALMASLSRASSRCPVASARSTSWPRL